MSFSPDIIEDGDKIPFNINSYDLDNLCYKRQSTRTERARIVESTKSLSYEALSGCNTSQR
jgi:hypothetical protein